MKLSEAKEAFYHFTDKLSNINRQIAFAGIAIVWIFKISDGENTVICDELVVPSILLIAALGLDILQYLYQSIAWAIFYRYHEKKDPKKDPDILASPCMNYPSWLLFILKVLVVIIAYGFILSYLVNNLLGK